MARTENARMLKEIKRRAPFRLKDIPELAQIRPDTWNSWSAARNPIPDEAFPPIAEALEKKAAELQRLAQKIREQYPPASR